MKIIITKEKILAYQAWLEYRTIAHSDILSVLNSGADRYLPTQDAVRFYDRVAEMVEAQSDLDAGLF